jgi:hypothetical protein
MSKYAGVPHVWVCVVFFLVVYSPTVSSFPPFGGLYLFADIEFSTCGGEFSTYGGESSISSSLGIRVI